ncbi:hypothetical protein [Streptomyces sp. NBC_00829]|uniref:hypothetical protein n=1 Tax=Streptomyces sp. NBC_00829 TaxID=2903679 RepID=UPI003868F88A|nr:hypothetical protein OG293_25685 [Streptomyces sp. NBC_00829]
MSWSLEDVGTASQRVDDVVAATHALMGSVENSRRAFDSLESWQALRTSASDMQTRMLDAGREAVERGVTWSSTAGGVRVMLIPRDDT